VAHGSNGLLQQVAVHKRMFAGLRPNSSLRVTRR
jgi:hypothetical protein